MSHIYEFNFLLLSSTASRLSCSDTGSHWWAKI